MVEVHAISEPGGHPVNEDAYLCEYHPAAPDCWLCCVADGQGGRAGGERAARLACQSVMQVACRTPAGMLAAAPAWDFVLQAADQAVAGDPQAGFSTLLGFCIRRGRIVGASSGDSAVVLLNRANAIVLTTGQIKNPPVGSGSAVFTAFAADLDEGWRVLAVTDGVWKYVGWDQMIGEAQSHLGQAALGEMMGLARLPRSGELQDDFTAVLVAASAEPIAAPAPAA